MRSELGSTVYSDCDRIAILHTYIERGDFGGVALPV